MNNPTATTPAMTMRAIILRTSLWSNYTSAQGGLRFQVQHHTILPDDPRTDRPATEPARRHVVAAPHGLPPRPAPLQHRRLQRREGDARPGGLARPRSRRRRRQPPAALRPADQVPRLLRRRRRARRIARPPRPALVRRRRPPALGLRRRPDDAPVPRRRFRRRLLRRHPALPRRPRRAVRPARDRARPRGPAGCASSGISPRPTAASRGGNASGSAAMAM